MDILCLLGSWVLCSPRKTMAFAITRIDRTCKLQHGSHMLACWLKDNNTDHWLREFRFVQWQKNSRLNSGIGRPPYNAIFGERSDLRLEIENLLNEVWENINMEEELAYALKVPEKMEMEEETESEEDLNIEEPTSSGTYRAKMLCLLQDF